MNYLTGLRCPKCGKEYPIEVRLKGCTEHRDKPSNLTPIYDYDAIRKAFDRGRLAERPLTMWRYQEYLPANPGEIVTMGEGMTPLIPIPRLGKLIGVPRLYVKNETVNPTWSHKDRMASVAVSVAPQFGKRAITASSSGNAGSATAAYAARAGMDCVIFTVARFPQAMKTQMEVYGTKLVAMPTVQDRWKMVETLVDTFGWFTTAGFSSPPIGSNPYGVDGYKTVGFEVCEQFGWKAPDAVVIPTGGDLFWGAWKGFTEFHDAGYIGTLPRMIAAETFGPLKNALEKGLDFPEPVPSGPTVAISAGVPYSTYLFLKAIRDSQGTAEVAASDDAIMEMQLKLAALEGIYAEASSTQTLAVVKQLREAGRIREDEVVVAVLTSTGLKHPEITSERLPEIPQVEPELELVLDALEKTYGFTITQQPVG
jgi:threonine synthase